MNCVKLIVEAVESWAFDFFLLSLSSVCLVDSRRSVCRISLQSFGVQRLVDLEVHFLDHFVAIFAIKITSKKEKIKTQNSTEPKYTVV